MLLSPVQRAGCGSTCRSVSEGSVRQSSIPCCNTNSNKKLDFFPSCAVKDVLLFLFFDTDDEADLLLQRMDA